MKKSFVAMFALGVLGGNAYAQSSVTIYGVTDGALLYNSNVGGNKLYAVASGNIQSNRLGFKGMEDLGNGRKALFVLENGFALDTGALQQGNNLFGRQAYVGLSDSSIGTVTMGRQYDLGVDFVGPLIAGTQWATYFAGRPGDLDNMNNANRVNNSIKYTSPNFNGLTVGGLYGMGESAGQFSRNRIWSAGAGYVNGPLSLGVGFVNAQDPNFSFFGNNPASSATGNNMAASRVYSGYASAKSQQILTTGAAYTLGSSTFGLNYSNTQFKGLGAEAGLNPLGYAGAEKFHDAEINFKHWLTPTLQLGAAYNFTKGYGVNSVKYNQGVVGVDYFLSKRTDFYAVSIYQHASGTDSSGGAAVANINGNAASSGSSQLVLVVGLRHKF